MPDSPADAPPAPPAPRTTPLGRVVGAMSAFGALFILVAFGLFAHNERERMLREAQAEAASTAFFLADHAHRLFEVTDVALRSADDLVEGKGWDEIAGSAEVQRGLKALANALPYVRDVWFHDAGGILRHTSLVFPAPPADASGREIFRMARERPDDLSVGPPIIGTVTRLPTYNVARGLKDADGAFRGMVSVNGDLAYFDDYWRNLRVPYRARVTLFRSTDLAVLAQLPRPAMGTYSPISNQMLEAVAKDPVVGAFEGRGPKGEGRIVAYRRVGELPLYLGVNLSKQTVLAAWWRRVRALLPFVGLAFAALGLMTLAGLREARREAEAARAVEEARLALARANEGLEERVRARVAEVEAANEEIQRFAQVVSHDLRAPLVNIMGFTSELEALRADLFDGPTGAPPPPEAAKDFDEAVGFIRAGINRMDGLIAGVLKLAREGRRVLRPEPLDLTALVREIVASVRHQADEAGAQVVVGALPRVTADRLAVGQVLGNLVDNAVKYLDPARPGRVEVRGRIEGARAIIEVADNGRGIAAAELDRVFEPFHRAGGAKDRPGDGIGLAHVRSLVRALGGGIALASEPGRGSTFTVTLPRAAPLEPPAPAGARAAPMVAAA